MQSNPFDPSNWSDSTPLATAEQCSAFEQEFSVKLPQSYTDFLCNVANGGRPLFEADFIPQAEPGGSFVEWLLGFRSDTYSLHMWYEDYYDITIKRCLPISMDGLGNLVIMSLRDERYGEIFFIDHERAPEFEVNPFLHKVATDFNEFMRLLREI